MERDQEFLEYIIKSLVDNPDDVKVERTVDDRGVLLTLSVNPSDMKIIIGKGGATIRGIKTILRMIGAKQNQRVNLKVLEPEGSERRSRDNDQNKNQEEKQDNASEENKQNEDIDDLSNIKI